MYCFLVKSQLQTRSIIAVALWIIHLKWNVWSKHYNWNMFVNRTKERNTSRQHLGECGRSQPVCEELNRTNMQMRQVRVSLRRPDSILVNAFDGFWGNGVHISATSTFTRILPTFQIKRFVSHKQREWRDTVLADPKVFLRGHFGGSNGFNSS